MENEDNIENQESLPPPTWDDVRQRRNQLLLEAEKFYNFDSPEKMKKLFRDYKQALKDMPQKYKDLKDLREIPWPDIPSDHQQQLYPARGNR